MSFDKVVSFDNIPAELRELPQWVCWRPARRNDGKATKVPYMPREGVKASSTDPSTWSTFGAARAHVDFSLANSHGWVGVGFVLTDDDPYVGLDLDSCFSGPGELHPAAEAIVRAMGSYTEVSPSGKGVRIIVRAAKPGSRCEVPTMPWGDEIGVFESGRYLTMTGELLNGTALPIADRQAELAALYEQLFPVVKSRPAGASNGAVPADDRELLERAFRARNGRRVRRLYDGDIDGYPSQSEADLALCSMLAFWTGPDVEALDRLFRSSALMRPKWERVGQRTILEALSGRDDFYDWSKRRKPKPKPAPEPEPETEAEAETVEPMALADAVAVFQRWLFLPDPEPLYACWGAIAANRVTGEPVWLLLVDVSGGGKTEIVRACGDLPECAHISALTEAGLMSGTSAGERAKDATGGVLRVIGDRGVIVAKDFTSVLAMEKNDRGKVLAAMREVYDGDYTRQLGTDGGRTLHWRGKAGFVGGVTPEIDRQYLVMARLGQRFLLHRPPLRDQAAERESVHRAISNSEHIADMRDELRAAALGVFAGCSDTPRSISDPERRWIVEMAMLVARGRAGVVRNPQGRTVDRIDPELPTRLAMELTALLAGMDAIGVPRREALVTVRNTALGCIPRSRWTALGLLHRDTRAPATRDVAVAMRASTETARRILVELLVHGLIERSSSGKSHTDHWSLTDWTRDRLDDATNIPRYGHSDFGISPQSEDSADVALGEDPEDTMSSSDSLSENGEQFSFDADEPPDEPPDAGTGCRTCGSLLTNVNGKLVCFSCGVTS